MLTTLIRVGQAGIVLNAEKFHFARRIVDFAGFRISDETIEPLPKYMDAIRDFPTPTSTTDVRSWFGLVNQVANYAQLRDIMTPFKPFLSPRCRFEWTPELERAFQASKDSIIAEIRHGVEIFDPRNEPAYAQIGLVKVSRTSCHRNIARVTRVYLTALQMVGGSRWPAPDS